MAMANTLAYYNTATMAAIKSFIEPSPTYYFSLQLQKF